MIFFCHSCHSMANTDNKQVSTYISCNCWFIKPNFRIFVPNHPESMPLWKEPYLKWLYWTFCPWWNDGFVNPDAISFSLATISSMQNRKFSLQIFMAYVAKIYGGGAFMSLSPSFAYYSQYQTSHVCLHKPNALFSSFQAMTPNLTLYI